MRFYWSIILLLGLGMSACTPFKRGMREFDKGKYNLAIKDFQKSINKEKSLATSYFYIGESYRLSNRVYQAGPYYKLSIEHGYPYEEAKLYLAQAYKASGEYENARETLLEYLESGSQNKFLKLAEVELDNLDQLDEVRNAANYFNVNNLSSINTPASEYSPLFHDGFLYFSSTRDSEGKIYYATGEHFSNIYRVPGRGANLDTTKIEKLPPQINQFDTNEGTMTIHPNGRTMVFARGNSGKRRGMNEVNLYITRLRNGQWTEPELMNINDPEGWDSCPAFSADGRTLYFASNREGGYGGIDIYSATVNSRGRWGNVQNLGSQINTPLDDMFPYASQDGKLYFASNGHPGFGGLDIFVAERIGGKIRVYNLGEPINGNKDDFAFFLFLPDRGFFSSNRNGGKGLDDIYTFRNEDPDLKIVNYILAGTTTTTNAQGEEVILPATKVRLIDNNGELLGESITGADGKFSFRIYPEEEFKLVADKNDYFTTRKMFSTIGKTVPKEDLVDLVTNKTFEMNINLEEIVLDKAIVLENIYYDFDKADIREDAAVELDMLVAILQDNPEITIELSSHTDSRGDAAYNMDLSQRRADSAVQYIISKGIEAKRMEAIGYGESKPILPNADTEEEHQINRRTEFKVTAFDIEKFKQRLKEEEEKFNEGTIETVETERIESGMSSDFDFDFN